MANQNEDVLIEGMRFFNPHANAPTFVIGEMVISLNDFFAWCKAHPELHSDYQGVKQVRIQIKESKQGNLYGSVNTYKPDNAQTARRPATRTEAAKPVEKQAPLPPPVDDLPF